MCSSDLAKETLVAAVPEKQKPKAKLLAAAAIAGEKVKKMSAKVTAADETSACADYYTKAGISSSLGACVATASSRRRALQAAAYDVEVFFKSSEISTSKLTAAAISLEAAGVTGVSTQTSVDPVAELKAIPGVPSNVVDDFEAKATAAAADAGGEAAAADFPTKPDCATLLRWDWEEELSPYGADCCGGAVGSGACWHDVKNVCEVPANYLPMNKPANKFPVFDGTDTCDTMIISYTYYNEYASPGTADKAFMAEDWDEPGCPFSDKGPSQRGAASETKKYFGACCSDGKTSCDGASSTVLAATAAAVAAVVALASI